MGAELPLPMRAWMQDLPWELDAVKDDVYRWEVKLKRFDESSPLAQVRRSLLNHPVQCTLSWFLEGREFCFGMEPLVYACFERCHAWPEEGSSPEASSSTVPVTICVLNRLLVCLARTWRSCTAHTAAQRWRCA